MDVTTEDSVGNEFVDHVSPLLGSLSGTVLEDTNGDDTGDVPLEGVLIVLKDETGKVLATTATDQCQVSVW